MRNFSTTNCQQRIARESAPAFGSKPHSQSTVDNYSPNLERRYGNRDLSRLRRLCDPRKDPDRSVEYLTQILKTRVDPVVSPNATISMF